MLSALSMVGARTQVVSGKIVVRGGALSTQMGRMATQHKQCAEEYNIPRWVLGGVVAGRIDIEQARIRVLGGMPGSEFLACGLPV